MTSKFKIAHLSDSHFGTVYPEVKTQLINTLKNISPDLVILSGDITQRARSSQFKEAKEFVESLPISNCLVAPGNHDIPLYNIVDRIFFPYRNFNKYKLGNSSNFYKNGNIGVLMLNSTNRRRHIQGSLNIKKINDLINRYMKSCTIKVVAFHHPIDCAKESDEKNLLLNKDQAVRELSLNDVDLVLNGHIHFPLVHLTDHRYPSLQKNMIICVAGTCTSWRTRSEKPNSFNLIEIDKFTHIPQIEVIRFESCGQPQFRRQDSFSFLKKDNKWISN